MRPRRARIAVAVAATSLLGVSTLAASATADDDNDEVRVVRAQLDGYQEDPLALSTRGAGQFRARVDVAAGTIGYRLTYAATEGTVAQAHIHLGGQAQSGGISVFLCSNAGPAGVQACPAAGTVTGTIRAANVIGPAAQGIAPGEFAELVAAIRAEATYVNVHTSLYPGGEIRGQIEGPDDDDGHDD